MSRVVVDTSIAIKWVLEEIHTPEARRLRDERRNGQITPIVPSWFGCEIANVFYQRMRGSIVSLVGAQRAIRDIFDAVVVQDYDPAVAPRALELAQQFAQSASYDAHYLALAEYLGCEFWTADQRLWRATNPVFPWVRWVGEVTISP